MKLKGIEFYDAVSFAGNKINTTAKSYMKWGVYPVNASSLYAYDGLYLHEFFVDASSYYGNTICLNFKIYMIQSKTSFSSYVSDTTFKEELETKMCIINDQLYRGYTIQDEKIYSYDECRNLMYYGYMNGTYPTYYNYNLGIASDTSRSPYAAIYNYVGGSGTKARRNELANFLQSGYHIYSLLFKDNVLTYAIDGNIFASVSCPILKYYSIFAPYKSSYSSNLSGQYAALQWVTLTDQICTVVPIPPYLLDEKDNEVYGYEKISTV